MFCWVKMLAYGRERDRLIKKGDKSKMLLKLIIVRTLAQNTSSNEAILASVNDHGSGDSFGAPNSRRWRGGRSGCAVANADEIVGAEIKTSAFILLRLNI